MLRRFLVWRPTQWEQTYKRFLSSSVDPLIQKYLEQAGIHDQKTQKGIYKALQSVHGNHVSLSHVESLGDAGVKALAEAVQRELQSRHTSPHIKSKIALHVRVPHHKFEFDTKWRIGESILDVAKGRASDLLGEYLEGTCGGQMSCCTCHVYVDKETLKYLAPPEEAELDMLDLAYEPNEQSRLGCQVILSQRLAEAEHKVEITIPADVNNVWS